MVQHFNPVQQIANQIDEAAGYKKIQIGNKVYSIRLLPASVGFSVATNLIKTFLPVLGSYADANGRKGLVLPEDDSVFSEMAILLCSQLDKIDPLILVQQLLADSLVNGKQFNFDDQFRANYSDLIKLIEFALKENFGDFFTGYLQEKGIKLGSLNLLSLKTAVQPVQTQEG